MAPHRLSFGATLLRSQKTRMFRSRYHAEVVQRVAERGPESTSDAVAVRDEGRHRARHFPDSCRLPDCQAIRAVDLVVGSANG
jgi:hypothetical protein